MDGMGPHLIVKAGGRKRHRMIGAAIAARYLFDPREGARWGILKDHSS